TDAVRVSSARRDQLKGRRILDRTSEGHRDLTARNGQRLNQVAGRGFPQPVSDLVVVRLRLARLDDVRVVAQPVEKLRTVGLLLAMLDEHLTFWSWCLGVDVEAESPLPHAGDPRERSQIPQRHGIDRRRFSKDILPRLDLLR